MFQVTSIFRTSGFSVLLNEFFLLRSLFSQLFFLLFNYRSVHSDHWVFVGVLFHIMAKFILNINLAIIYIIIVLNNFFFDFKFSVLIFVKFILSSIFKSFFIILFKTLTYIEGNNLFSSSINP